MIERYTLPPMDKIWSEEYKISKWLQVETAILKAWAKQGKVPSSVVEEVEKARVDLNRMKEIEEEVGHDVIAFVKAATENLSKDAKRFFHYGATSYDIVDTALSLLLRESADVIIEEIRSVIELLKQKASEYKFTPMMGRTHGMFAEPITLGFKFALWFCEMGRNLRRMEEAKEVISYGKISGAVGIFGNSSPEIEEIALSELGLKPAPVSTQILQRDRHAQYLSALAFIASSLEKFATEIRNLQRSNIEELQEPFGRGQRGSSAMPHKRNPIICERICSLARVIRAYLITGFENIPLWGERDLTNSAAERIIFPQATTLTHYILAKFRGVLKGLVVNERKMKENIEKTLGTWGSESLMLRLIDKGLTRDEAYELVQKLSFKAMEEGKELREVSLSDERIRNLLTPEEIERCFDLKEHLRWIDYIFRRAGIDES
jgi:adenylosuccinate lyase